MHRYILSTGQLSAHGKLDKCLLLEHDYFVRVDLLLTQRILGRNYSLVNTFCVTETGTLPWWCVPEPVAVEIRLCHIALSRLVSKARTFVALEAAEFADQGVVADHLADMTVARIISLALGAKCSMVSSTITVSAPHSLVDARKNSFMGF